MKVSPFRAEDYLDSEEVIEAYLKEAYAEGDPVLIQMAEEAAVKARANLAADRVIKKVEEARNDMEL